MRPPTFLAAYAGPSMNPTLSEPELLEVMPFTTAGPQVGDVVLFVRPHSDRPVVHRVFRITAAGITTRGDHNAHADATLVQRKDMLGRVVGAWRGSEHRRIAGGLRGHWTSHWMRTRRICEERVCGLLHPAYRALARWGWLARQVPPSLRPRVVIFRVQGEERRRLLWGRRVVGQYDRHTRQWHVRRPFRLCVDVKVLRDQGGEP